MSTVRARLADMQSAMLMLNNIQDGFDTVATVLQTIETDFADVWSDSGYDTFLPHLQDVKEQVATLMANANSCKNALNTAVANYANLEGRSTKELYTAVNEFSFPT